MFRKSPHGRLDHKRWSIPSSSPSRLAYLDARSSYLLQEESGILQPFPNTAAALIAALGSPAGVVAADIQGTYCMDTAAPMVDSLGLGPSLAVTGGTELAQRECIGLPDTTFASKSGAEYPTNNACHAAMGTDYGAVPVNAQRSFLYVVRPRDDFEAWARTFAMWGFAKMWGIYRDNVNRIYFVILDPGAHTLTSVATLSCQWMYFCATFDDATKTARLYSSIEDLGPLAYANPIVDANPGRAFAVGLPLVFGGSAFFQCAYIARIDKLLVKADCTAFWRHANPAGLGTPNTYARANPLVCPIQASRVACYGANQLAVGYSAGFLADGNAGQTGVCCEDGATFLGTSSNNLVASGAAGAWSNSNTTGTQIDGPSGMRDAIRVTMLANWLGVAPGNYLYNQTLVPLAGATNVPFEWGAAYKRGVNGTTARVGLYTAGDGGGPEYFTIISDAATPVDWALYAATVTPARPAHDSMYQNLGAALNGNDCDFAELYCMQNRATPSLSWRRCGVVSAATSTPALSMTNVGNARYNPVQGRIVLNICEFGGTNNAVFLSFGAAEAAGSLVLDYSGDNLRLRLWDDTATLIDTLTCGAVNASQHIYTIIWNSITGTLSITESGSILDSGTPGTWVPEPNDITPIYIGSDPTPANAARCFVELLEIYDY